MAEDTAGEAAAGPFYDAAAAEFTTLIDTRHTLPTLYNMVNVPTAVWVDEDGRIVRHDEDAYSAIHQAGTFTFGRDDYRPAVYDWVRNGAASRYVQSPEEVLARIPSRTPDEARADPTFKLAVHFYLEGDLERANRYWDEAQTLNPSSWNYHRQDWSFLDPAETGRNWLEKVQALDGKPYYKPLDFPDSP
ncbi:MAG: hypothetical protein R3190_12110 [Thermoanaerobaculia bacterium]|nr:hypothetical protein [Thermoanaerobaculia bacterium]